jgi:hypothetical protein
VIDTKGESDMKSRIKAFSIVSATHVIAALLFVFPLAASAQQAGSQAVSRSKPAGSLPRLLNGKPDFSRLWANPGTLDLSVKEINGCSRVPQVKGCSYKGPGSLPMTEWGEQWYKEFNHQLTYDVTAHCFPLGYTQQFWNAPLEILSTPTRIGFLFEDGTQWRMIYTDGRPNPKFEEAEITWNGHSVGHWEGDTLVVDTVGPWWGVPMMVLDTTGHPVSDVLHLVERIRLIDADTLEIETTFDDPKAYTRPWKSTRIMKPMPAGERLIGQICQENNHEASQGLMIKTNEIPDNLRRFSQWPDMMDGAFGPLPGKEKD